jgi:ketosteroid isomerase-like protein
MGAEDLHGAVEKAVNNRDVEGLVALYEPDACMLGPAGEQAVGLDAIRATWEELLAFDGSLAMTTLSAVEAGDLAYLANRWEMTIDGAVVASAITAEVARQQADGSWKYVIDNPYAAEVSIPDAG